MAPSPLLELPAELRNYIFGLVLVSPERIVARITWHLPSEDEHAVEDGDETRNTTTAPIQQPGLTRINSQVRSEALPVFYSQSTFLYKAAIFTLRPPHPDLRQRCTLFTNETAVKYVKHIVCAFGTEVDLRRNIRCSPLDISITLDEQDRVRYSVNAEVCLCVLWKRLAEEEGTHHGVKAKLANAVVALSAFHVPGMLVPCRHMRFTGRCTGCVKGHWVCAACGKPRHVSTPVSIT